MKHLKQLAALALALTLSIGSAHASARYTDGFINYTVEDGSVVIVSYVGKEEEVTLPSAIAGQPVSVIDSGAFADNSAVKKVNLPDTVMEVRDGAFSISQTVVYNANTDHPNVSEATTEPPASGQMTTGQPAGNSTQETTAESAAASDGEESQFSVEEVEVDLSRTEESSAPSEDSTAPASESEAGSADAQETTPAVGGEQTGDSETASPEHGTPVPWIVGGGILAAVGGAIVLSKKKK